MIPRTSGALGRTATLAILPLMAVAIYLAFQAGGGDEGAPAASFEPEGLLVIADLAGGALVIHDASSTDPPATLSLSGAPHELVAAGDRLYVTLDRADRIVEVDPYAPGVLRTLELPGRPHGITNGEPGQLLVSLDEAATVAVVDRESFEVVDELETGDTPHAVAFADGVTYVTGSRENTVRAIRDGGSETAPAGDTPEALALAGGRLFAANAGSSTISAFHAATLEPAGEWSLPGRPVRLLAMDNHLLVALKEAGEVAVMDIESDEEVARFAPGALPDGLCVSPSGDYLGVSANGDGALAVVAIDGWEPLGSMHAGAAPGACAWLSN